MAEHEHVWGLTCWSMATRCLRCGILQPDPEPHDFYVIGTDQMLVSESHVSDSERIEP